MSDMPATTFDVSDEVDSDIGGLRFSVSFRAPAGVTLRVSAELENGRQEVLRFDDFVEKPHYHVPSSADATIIDPKEVGAPLDFYIAQIRDNLRGLLVQGGFPQLAEAVDLAAVTRDVDLVRQSMIDIVPDGYVRVPGVGLQRAGS